MRRIRIASILAVTACAVLVPVAGPVHAGGSVVHDVAGHKALAEGELEALSLDAAGIVRVGAAFEPTPLDADSAWAATTVGDDLWIGTGGAGDLLRLKKDGSIDRISTDDGVLITAVAPLSGGAVVAAVFPGARLLKVAPDGTTSTLATLPAEHIWSIAPDTRGGLVAATGVPGALFSVDAFGAVEKIADVGDDHARCLVSHDGAFLVGTAPRGLLLSVRGREATVLRDLDAQEVIGIVPSATGGLLVAANADTAGGNPQQLASLLNQIRTPPETKPGQKVQPRASLQSGTVLWIEPSGAVTTLWTEAKVAALTLADDGKGGAFLGTYPSGRVFRVAPDMPPALFADLPEAEASVIVTGTDGLVALMTSNPAVAHRSTPSTRIAGTWTSAPIDAGAEARWGRVRVAGSGLEALAWRSGETEEPDDTWSGWQKAVGDGSGGWATGARARFLQVRITLAGADAELRGLSVVAVAPNQSPRITEWKVTRKGEKKGAKGIPEPTPLKTLAWKTEDPDGDALTVSLHAKRDGSPFWIELVKDEALAKPTYEWDTAGLPDGTYVARLVVSDATDNAAGRARETTRLSAPFRVDNTAPHVTVKAQVAGEDRLLVSGEAKDQPGGRIAQVRVSVDGGPWQVLEAVDAVFDDAAEGYEGSLPLPPSGAHDVVVQARDAAGNMGAAATAVTVR